MLIPTCLWSLYSVVESKFSNAFRGQACGRSPKLQPQPHRIGDVVMIAALEYRQTTLFWISETDDHAQFWDSLQVSNMRMHAD